MTRIITISRQFGSGGREVGTRLAEELGFTYYDREIISKLSDGQGTGKNSFSMSLDAGMLPPYPLTYGRTFANFAAYPQYNSALLIAQQNTITQLAQKGDCVFVGRCADSILKDFNPLKLFVYADMPSRVERCRGREKDGEHFSNRELQRRIRQIDANRKRLHDMFSDGRWGKKENYDLMLNTTGIEIKKLIPPLKEYALAYFRE
ncbi:MAG: cytidylate kinase-like family protein [Clostridia bacterium]|nr:cytidylate kinase-like family protein [Clostridia bacterium]